MKFYTKLFFNLLCVAALGADVAQKPIAIIVPSRNNNALFEGKLRYQLNLDSIFSQEYDNYRIIYLDDNSTDGTADAVYEYCKEHDQLDRLTLVRNKVRYGPSRNRYVGVQLADNNEIAMFLDGDDMFSNSHVLQRVNQEYQNPNIWVTYSQFETIPNHTFSGGAPVPQWVIDENKHREYGWYYHSLKTFYAWLGKLEKLEDILYDGNFYPISSDIVEMFPIVEMSGGRFSFIPDIMYYATQYASNEMHVYGKELMSKMSAHIFKLPPYQPLQNPKTRPIDTTNATVDVVLLSDGNLEKLQPTVDALTTNLGQLNTIMVVVDERSTHAIQELNVDGAQLIVQPLNFATFTAQDVLDAAQQLPSDYVILAHDGLVLTAPVDTAHAISILEATFAHAVYFSISPEFFAGHTTPLLHVTNQVHENEKLYAWQFKMSLPWFANFNFRNYTLYRASDLGAIFSNLDFAGLNQMLNALHSMPVDTKKLGLFFAQNKVGQQQ